MKYYDRVLRTVLFFVCFTHCVVREFCRVYTVFDGLCVIRVLNILVLLPLLLLFDSCGSNAVIRVT